jgi:HSP20 family protein
MAQVMKKEEEKSSTKPAGEMIPVRPTFALHPANLAERFEELFGEPLGSLRWPIRWPEISWPQEMAKMPSMDIFEEGDTIVAKAELPGLAKADLDVRISGDVLTVSGKKEKEEKIERKDYHRYERSSGSFSRSVLLPAEVEVDKVSAQLKDGVLEVRAPKTAAARARSRKIEVT